MLLTDGMFAGEAAGGDTHTHIHTHTHTHTHTLTQVWHTRSTVEGKRKEGRNVGGRESHGKISEK